jgi:transcriptional regulator of nitric oxide reductase
MTENAPKVCLNDIMSVLSDPSVVPSLEAEREALAARLAQIDRMLSILRPSPPNPTSTNTFAPRVDNAVVVAVKGCLRPGYQYETRDITKATGYTQERVYAALATLRARGEVDSNGSVGRGARWFLV